MRKIQHLKTVSIITAFCLAAALASSAQTFKTLFSFPTGEILPGDLVQGRNGHFYGLSQLGGANAWGSILEVSGQGVSVLYNFCALSNCTDGGYPQVGVVLGADGNFYGTTFIGGISTCDGCGGGTIFKASPSGTVTTLYDFCTETNCDDGFFSEAKLVQASNGAFFGTTFYGGTNRGAYNTGNGTLFSITPSGKFSSLYSFCAQTNCTDGANPHWAPMQASDGKIYGTTYWGGTYNSGTVFVLTGSGKIKTLHSFAPGPGSNFTTGPLILMQAADGNLYGTTNAGGADNFGTIFKLTAAGKFSTVYTFCSKFNCVDGAGPTSLIQGPDGNFYGTTALGGTGLLGCGGLACGTIFQLTPEGTLTTLYNFCTQVGCRDGNGPGALLLATDGTLYGTTGGGGAYGNGTLFSESVGFVPFVQPNPATGKAGQVVGILGNDLAGTTSVTFHGIPTTFTVVSTSFIKATVPSGATTGPIEVTTPSGTLASIVSFQVN